MHPASIGPFQIVRELGRGGMGEVYLARDTRLDRQVAIKALPAHLAADPDRLARFQREAKVLASLNHPGIGAIYGLEEAGGHQYLILEYIEGETLAARLTRGAIPVDEALVLGAQIAEALEVAHEKGVIHRDLKPANVMVTREGVAKVLDFGLARTAEGTPPSTIYNPALANSPTLTSPMHAHSPTIPGVIMGTAGYMSPEQARGKPLDKRTDIWSFGCVLYECLTGALVFGGETTSDAIAAILEREPDWSKLPPRTPPRVRDLLKHCLEKDPRRRLRDAGDAKHALEQSIAGREWNTTGMLAAVGGNTRSWKRTARIALASVALIALGAAASRLIAKPQPPFAPAQTFHVSTSVPVKPAFSRLVGISPDARFLVFIASPDLSPEGDKPRGILMVRRLDRDETKAIDGTEGVRTAALSADGRWIAYSCQRDRAGTKISLKKVGLVDGQPNGNPVSLCELPPGWSDVCWASDREIVFAGGSPEPTLAAVSADGGEPRIVLREQGAKDIGGWGAIRPLVDGKSILGTRFTLVAQTLKTQVEAVDLATGKRTVVLPDAGPAQYLPEGYLLAVKNQNTLIAVKFDPETLQLIGSPAVVLNGANDGEFVMASRSGTLAMVTRSTGASSRRLAWIDELGQALPIPGAARAFDSLAVSPDSSRVASIFAQPAQLELPSELWVHDLARRTFSRLQTKGAPLGGGLWSNDGERITYGTIDATDSAIWERRADGAGEVAKLFSAPSNRTLLLPLSWSPDSTVLAVGCQELGSDAGHVWLLEQGTDSKEWVAKPYLDSKVNEGALGFSPDGKWVRFVSDQSGRSELYVQRFTGAGAGPEDAKTGRRQISNSGGGWTSWWGGDGKEIRYLDADDQIMSVQIQTEPSFSASLPKVLYSIKDVKRNGEVFAADGRLMVILQGEGEQITRIDLVVNFIEELRAKMATPAR